MSFCGQGCVSSTSYYILAFFAFIFFVSAVSFGVLWGMQIPLPKLFGEKELTDQEKIAIAQQAAIAQKKAQVAEENFRQYGW
tara:strand:+ start:708 stop:953 length:246 start_codon:yes stop_codon:yes gene_type:complete